jgi:hypothetical protein
MKYIKQYENNTEPKVDDYVIVSINSGRDTYFDFLNSTVGTYISKNTYGQICVIYTDVPKNLRPYFNYHRGAYYNYFKPEEIVFWSPNKEDVIKYIELMKNVSTYNL